MHSQKRIELIELSQKVEEQHSAGLPFVMYSYPNSQEVYALFQHDSTKHYASDFQESGFVFAPFDSDQNAILLKPDSLFVSGYKSKDKIASKKIKLSDKGKAEHIDLVKSGIEEINAGNLEKVVLSKKIVVETRSSFLRMIKLALQLYPNAFCYVWYHPKVGMWLGASPEQLLLVHEDILETTSLAGTLAASPNSEAEWTMKEYEEQEMVTNFLLEELREVLDNVKASKVKSVRAGNLWHLKTKITASLKQKNILKDLIYRIHPSPAVCGLPKKQAKEFIVRHEGYDRNFYTGFMGELNFGPSGSTSLFVNLRCMNLSENEATIFVGGGITKDSKPENEWHETQNKSQTILSLI